MQTASCASCSVCVPEGRGRLSPSDCTIAPWAAEAHENVPGSTIDDDATVACLVPAHTSEGWWHRYVLEPAGRARGGAAYVAERNVFVLRWQHLVVELEFLKGRQRFTEASGYRKDVARFPSAVVVFRQPAAAARRKPVLRLMPQLTAAESSPLPLFSARSSA